MKKIRVGQVWKRKSNEHEDIVILATNESHSIVGGNVPDIVDKKFSNEWIFSDYELRQDFIAEDSHD